MSARRRGARRGWGGWGGGAGGAPAGQTPHGRPSGKDPPARFRPLLCGTATRRPARRPVHAPWCPALIRPHAAACRYSFPRYRGGPLFYADQVGLPVLQRTLEAMAIVPAPLLKECVAARQPLARYWAARQKRAAAAAAAKL